MSISIYCYLFPKQQTTLLACKASYDHTSIVIQISDFLNISKAVLF